MSFFRHEQIHRSDGAKDTAGYGEEAAPRTHRFDESAAGYCLAGCAPAEPASTSPVVDEYATKRWKSQPFPSERHPVPYLLVSRNDRTAALRADALQVSPDELQAAILLFHGLLDEQQRRLFAGLESIRLGHGGDTLLGDLLGLNAHTVARGRRQLLDQNVVTGRTRRPGGGRPSMGEKRPT